jgi:hypothetical protein
MKNHTLNPKLNPKELDDLRLLMWQCERSNREFFERLGEILRVNGNCQVRLPPNPKPKLKKTP